MSFEVRADAYGQFMGRYSRPLAERFAATVALAPGDHALDVGCGTGVLTEQLVTRLRADAVSAVDPSMAFVSAVHSRFPLVEARQASAERLPFPDDRFDVTMAQLVVHFMSDPATGLREMARVTRPGGVVAACVWDLAGGRGPTSVFWRAAADLDPHARDESPSIGGREGELAELFAAAGLQAIESTALTVTVSFAGFDEWWKPFTLGVGPAGDYFERLDARRRDELRDRCASLLPRHGPFDVTASAWSAAGRAAR